MKYPTFTPPPAPVPVAAPVPVPVSTSKLAQAYAPIPVRHHYDHDDTESQQSGMGSNVPGHPFQQIQQSNSGYRQIPQPATPAPSPPPPSPKPKKQQFQTDQNRPFLFPFSRSQMRYNGSRLVPYAIDEADKLYTKHMYVSLSLWQMWRTREECMTSESGLERMPGSEPLSEPKLAPTVCPVIGAMGVIRSLSTFCRFRRRTRPRRPCQMSLCSTLKLQKQKQSLQKQILLRKNGVYRLVRKTSCD